MSHAIADLLERGIPEPARLLDPDEVVVRGRRRVRNRRLSAIGVVTTIAGVAVVG